jgi:3-hydroxyisobutyrate dehydrogenase
MSNTSINIAVLGLGAMGSRMAARLLAAGYKVNVWNRTPERAQALVAQGALVGATPRDTVRGAQIAIAMVRDDDASRDVWLNASHGALAALAPDAVAIECSTLSIGWVKELASIAKEKRVAFLDAPVVGSRPQAEAGQLIFLAGGNAATLDRVRPLLAQLGSAVQYAGESGSGAVVKLAVNAMFGVQVAAIAEVLALAKREGINANGLLGLMGNTPVLSTAAKNAAGAMIARNFAPMFPVELVEKDFAYAMKSASNASAQSPVIASVHEVLKDAVSRGLKDMNLTALATLYE